RIGLPTKVRKPDGSTVAPEPGVKEKKISECVERLKAIGDLIKQSINLYEAWEALCPATLGGTWKVTNLPDPHVLWSVDIEQTSKNRFEGKLTGHGAARDRLRARASEWFDEEKAQVEISRTSPADKKLTFKWKPAVKKIQKCVPSVLTQVSLSIDPEGEGDKKKYLIGLTLAGWNKELALSAAWEILKLLNAAAGTLAGKKKREEEPSALMPRKLS